MSTDACAIPDHPGLVTGLLADTDCQAFGLVERGYAALSAPGSATATTITSLMVIAVAFFGYQLMLGRGLRLADLTGLALRLGVVIMLAASWSTLQGAAYDTLARAPTRVADQMITALNVPPPLEGVQTALDKIEAASIGWRQRAGIASPLVGGPPTTAMTLNLAAFMLTMTTAGLLVISRVVLALLLALTPVLAGFLLFNATRGLLEGWLRALLAAALVPVGVLTLTAVELAIITPMLDRILAQETAGQYLAESVTPLGLVTLVFTAAIIASLAALRSIANGIRLARTPAAPEREPMSGSVPIALAAEQTHFELLQIAAQPAVVHALERSERRETPARSATFRAGGEGTRGVAQSQSIGAGNRAVQSGFAARETGSTGLAPLRPQLRTRASRAAKRRDR